ncbi:MFS transporter [Prosthecomicrobium hirschii]|uniref:MFS transporter n=1 Tax=Prosthecodimorpha hirschii TaxID=665126 RepID=A0A0P6WDV1_9HYPH|nr:MFS transporter [Prosthecomicrobium hirschii]KPL54652.1 MFS transporter [Prosthecomicrobium hirschii]
MSTTIATADEKLRTRLVAATVAVAFFIQFLDGTIIATSLPQMAASFGTDAVSMSSGFTVYMLTAAAFMPLSGWLAERFGARRVFLASLLIFTLASLACGLAGSLPAFLAARTLQGFGAALMTPVGRLIVIRSATKSEIVQAIATITWPALFAPVIGPLLGSWITTHAGWQWNFFVNLPLGLVGCLLVVAVVPVDRPGPRVPFDAFGFVASAGSLTLLLAGLELFAGRQVPDLAAAGLAVAGLVVGIAACRHLVASPVPLIDLRVLRVRTFALSTLGAGTFCRLAVNATPFLLPLLLQVGFGLSAVETGILILVYFLGNLAMKSVTTPLLRRFGFRDILIVNGTAAALCIAAFAAVTPATPVLLLWALLFLAGATRSLQFTALATLAFADVDGQARSAASSLSAILQQLAMVGGIAVAVLAIRLVSALRGEAGAADLATLADFRAAFLIVAAIGLAGALRFLSLDHDAGREVSGHRG